MRRQRVAIDLSKEIEDAIERVWARRLKWQAEGRDFRGDSLYFVAGDVEREVRDEFERRMGTHRTRISGLNGHSLLGRVRNVLLSQARAGKWDAHNHGRGHISGMRFRAPGTPLSASEEKTANLDPAERRRRQCIKHLAREDGKAACGADDKKRSRFSRPRRFRSSPTTDPSKVTCKRCSKLAEKQAGAQ